MVDKVAGSVLGNSSSATGRFSPLGFKAGGVTLSFPGKAFANVKTTDERQGLVNASSGVLAGTAGEFSNLRGLIAPGFSRLRSARLSNIGAARRRSVGDLSQNLRNRRVRGSSFGEDALGRRDAEFAKLEDEAIAETELQEIEVTRQLIAEESTFATAAIERLLQEEDFQVGIASGAAQNATNVIAQIAQARDALAQNQVGSLLDIIGTGLGFKFGKPPVIVQSSTA